GHLVALAELRDRLEPGLELAPFTVGLLLPLPVLLLLVVVGGGRGVRAAGFRHGLRAFVTSARRGRCRAGDGAQGAGRRTVRRTRGRGGFRHGYGGFLARRGEG